MPRERSYEISEEFGHRLGCGMITAATLPVWFLLVLLAIEPSDSGLAVTVASIVLVAVVIGAAIGFARIRRVPRTVTVTADDRLVLDAPAGTRTIDLDDIDRIEIASTSGVLPIRIVVRDGADTRLSRDLQRVDDLLDVLCERRPDIDVTGGEWLMERRA
ncbi:MAG: hypothetical protein S0880_17755 [Actinomycetota bacterium]|nr:hypothetical protein [Actinomycetota bacterium]